MMNKALYIHIPFCKTICTYCAFTKIINTKSNIYDDYFNKLLKDIDNIKNDFNNIETIFIGGGTPNCVPLKYLKMLFEKLFLIRPIEYTIELNPELIDISLINLLKEYKITRVSIGVETINKNGIKVLGRKHTKKQIKDCFLLLRKHGFKNISLDFIFNYPLQKLKDLKKDLSFIRKLKPDHVSYYDLIVEDNTKINYLIKKKVYNFPDSDISYKFFKCIIKYLKKYKYNHYEISSFAKEGFECVHNKYYWLSKQYYGLGSSAVGFINNFEIKQSDNIKDYLLDKDIRRIKYKKEDLIKRDLIANFRLLKGVFVKDFDKHHKCDLFSIYPKIDNLIKHNLIKYQDGFLSFTEKGLFLGNIVLEEFV